MVMNFPILLLAALIPMVMGFIWYNPKVLGTVWMEAANMTEEKMKGGNMALIFGLSFVLAILLAMMLNFIVIHQSHLYSIFHGQPEQLEATLTWLNKNAPGWDGNFRTFKAGAFHGLIAGIMFVLPIMATNAMFERKGFKYIAVNTGYWIITITLMGGVICQFA